MLSPAWGRLIRFPTVKHLAWIEETIGAKLRANAIGKPVFVRANLQLIADHGHLVRLAAEALGTASKWMAAPVRSVYAQGGVRQGFISLMAEFDAGQSALLAVELTHGQPAEVQVLVVGQHGTLRFDDFPEPLQLSAAEPSPSAQSMRLIEASLANGQLALAGKE